MMNKNTLISIIGPTATGKTNIATRLAYELNGEIISADSRQVFRGMDIGTGKDLNEYTIEGRQIPYHLIDIIDPPSEYSVYDFQQDFIKSYNKIVKRGKQPILCGGTGLYLESVFNKYKLIPVPENSTLRSELKKITKDALTKKLKSYGPIHNTTDTEDVNRLIRAIEIQDYYLHKPNIKASLPEIDHHIFGIFFDRQIIRKRITHRLKERLENGMVEEVRQLLNKGISPERMYYYGLEYKFLTQHIIGNISYDEMFQLLNTAIHQFAKRQMTWFRRMERKGINIFWIDGNRKLEEKTNTILEKKGG